MKIQRIDTIPLGATISIDPSQACTRRIGILGGTGSGKTYAASYFVEQLFLAGAPFLVIDPVGTWGYGLRLAADGVSPGLPIPVIGGDFGDIGFDPSSGATIAEFLRERDASAVIDVSDLSGAKLTTFIADLFESLYRVSRRRRTPYTVVLEEGQTFIPQNIGRGEERMFGAVRRWGRLSRNYGGGLIIVTQRPQSVSKEVFNQIELMLVGNLRGPHERKAVREWVKEQGAEEVEAMLKELPKLKPGDLFAWSPEWLQRFEKVRVGKKLTFDSSNTPTLGKAAEGRTLAPIELGELGILMKSTALLEEPKKGSKNRLAAQDAELSRKLGEEMEASRKLGEELAQSERLRLGQRAALAHVMRDIGEAARFMERAGELLIGVLKQPVFALDDSLGVESAIRAGAVESAERVDRHAEALGDLVEAVDQRLTDIVERREPAHMPRGRSQRLLRAAKETAAEARNHPTAPGEKTIATVAYMNALLAVIAQHGPLDRHKLSILSGKSRSSSTFASGLRMLAGAEPPLIIDDRRSGLISATPLGKKQADAPELPTGRALYDYWKGRLGDYDRKIFETIATGPKAGLSRADIAKRTGQSYSSSTFAQAFRTLRSLGLVAEQNGLWRLDETVRAACGL